MCTGTVLPLAQWNILSCVSFGSKGTFQRPWKWRALRRTRRVSSDRDPDAKKSGMAPTKEKPTKRSQKIQKLEEKKASKSWWLLQRKFLENPADDMLLAGWCEYLQCVLRPMRWWCWLPGLVWWNPPGEGGSGRPWPGPGDIPSPGSSSSPPSLRWLSPPLPHWTGPAVGAGAAETSLVLQDRWDECLFNGYTNNTPIYLPPPMLWSTKFTDMFVHTSITPLFCHLTFNLSCGLEVLDV